MYKFRIRIIRLIASRATLAVPVGLSLARERFSTGLGLSRVPLSQCPEHMNFVTYGVLSNIWPAEAGLDKMP
jgi:hypothetical protein